MSIKSSLRTVSVGVAALFFSVCGSTHAALLYGVSGDGLYSINIANLNYGAVSTRLGFTGNSGGSFAMQSIAFDPAGMLYGISGDGLYTINTTTGISTLLGITGNSGGSFAMQSIAFDPAGMLYGISGHGLYSINIANLNYGAVSTRLGFTGNSGGSFAMQDIAFAPEVAAIPEPATYTMLMAGMVLLGLTFHRNKQNTSTMLGMA